MNDTVYERACKILQSSKLKLTFAKLKKQILIEFPSYFSKDEYDEEIRMAKDWYSSLVHYSFPKNSDAFIYFEKHIQPILFDSEHGTVWRLNKNGNVKPTPLDLSKKYKLQYLYDNTDKSFEYFDINTYTIEGKEKKDNHLPLRRKQNGDFNLEIKGETQNFNRYKIEFYYQGQWLDLLKNSKLYQDYPFKDLYI